MGNHAVGEAMSQMAENLITRRRDGEAALAMLDTICEPYRNTDAEFSYSIDPHAETALGVLLVEAFAPNGADDLERYMPMLDDTHPRHDAASDDWHREIYEPFIARYGFC